MIIFDVLKKKFVALCCKLAKRILSDQEIKREIAEIVQRPADREHAIQGNIRVQLWQHATQETAAYVREKMLRVQTGCGRDQMLEIVFSEVEIDGLYLEFGVATGKSINAIAKYVQDTVHGFDSFEGLPEDWFDHLRKGMFSMNHQIPECAENVELHIGWFDETLPKFADAHEGQIAFMHVDCDLYSSTKVIFDILGNRIASGTVILFDEYFNYPGWQNHEFKAFQEFITEKQLRYKYIAYDRCYFAVLVKIL
jgi:hypothetical protein